LRGTKLGKIRYRRDIRPSITVCDIP